MHFIDSDLAYRVFDAVKELPEVERQRISTNCD